MKSRMFGLLSAVAAAAFLCLPARAEAVTEDLLNPNDPTDVWGRKITGLGAGGDETALVFTKTGETMSWTLPDGVKLYDFLVVGGGGGGGGFTAGGGGGGGGVVTGVVNSVETDVISVTVGDGGAGGATNGGKGVNGSDSQIAASGNPLVVAYGGGGGAGKGFNSGTVGSGGGGNGGTTLTGKSASKGYFDETKVTAFTFGNKGGNSKKDSPTACAWSGAGGGGATEAGVDVTEAGLPSDGKGGGTKGGEGLTCDITGVPGVYGSGGGGGASNTYGHRGYGGTNAGNGVQNKSATSRDGVANFGGGGGGGGANDSAAKGGNGGSGIVVIRYRVMAANEVIVPTIAGATYNGELHTADISDGEGYTVTANAGGTNAGDYPVVLTLVNGYYWVGGSTDPTNLTFTIAKAANSWTTQPSLSKTTWGANQDPAVANAGVALSGTEVVVTYDDGATEMPLSMGQHTVNFSVPESQNYLALESSINFTVTKKVNSWTGEPVVTNFNIEDPAPVFTAPIAAFGEVSFYYDGDPAVTAMPTSMGSHTVTYTVAEGDDYLGIEQTIGYAVTYRPIVDSLDPSKVYGYRIPNLGVNQDEVALVFTNTDYSADNPMRWTLPREVTAIEYLAVGGGGGGAGWVGSYGLGGGGAGGVVSNAVSVSDASISVVVGKGGNGCTSDSHNGKSGGASQLAFGDQPAIVAYGGGKGGCAEPGVGGEGYGSGGGGGSKNIGGTYTSLAGGAANPDGQGHAGGAGYSGTFRGGGGGGAGEDGWMPTSSQSGKGGDGIVSGITGDDVWYAGGGGGGAQTNNGGIASPGGKGGGGAGGACASNQQAAGKDATYYGGGGGAAKGNANGGSGHQGVVIIRYVEPAGVVMVPYIAPKTYTGETLVADVPANVGYTVTKNEGGTDAGDYEVVLTLAAGCHWDGGSTEPTNLVFTIVQAQNEWTVEPSITKATWLTTEEPGVLTAGATKFGVVTPMIAKDGGDAEAFDGTLPTATGAYAITYTAPPTTDSYLTPEIAAKTVEFTIVGAEEMPDFTVAFNGEVAVGFDAAITAAVPYRVNCEVASPKTVTVYAKVAENGSDTTNTVVLATGVSLDGSGVGVLNNMKPGATYSVALYGEGEGKLSPVTEPVEFTTMGPATNFAASTTFTNDPKEFVITGSVTPGLGTTTVTVRWSLNSDAIDQFQTFTFAYGDAGAFESKVAYENVTDTLTWKVEVENDFTSATYGELKWNDEMAVQTKSRADTAQTVYTWTGTGENNDWANPANWSADKAECFGYPDNEDYAKAKITRTVTINLGGKTFAVVKGEALVLEANSGDVVTLTNGTLKAEYYGDGDFGAAGTTVIFRDATLNRTRLNPKDGMTVIFESASTLTGMVRPWTSSNVKIIFRNGDITVSGNFGNGNAASGTEVVISNATVTVQGRASGSWGPGTYPLQMYNGPDRQARLIHTNSYGFDFVQSPYTLTIPEQPYATPYLQALKPGDGTTTKSSPTFNIDVTNWKRGKRVPILTFTQSASGAAEQYGNATLKAYDEEVDVTEKRNARLVWDEDARTLYYQQDSLGGLAILLR